MMNVSISPQAGTKGLKPPKPEVKQVAALPVKERKAYWPREEKGYETREEKARRENREQAKERRRRQKKNESRRRQEELDAMFNTAMMSGPELNMHLGGWDNDASTASANNSSTGYGFEWEMAGSVGPKSPPASTSPLPGGSTNMYGSLIATTNRPSSPLSEGSGSPLMGVRVDLSPKKMPGNKVGLIGGGEKDDREVPETIPAPILAPPQKIYKPPTGELGTPAQRPFTVANTYLEPSSYSVNYFGVHRGEMGMLSHRRNIPQMSGREVLKKKATVQVGIGGGFVQRIPKSQDPRLKDLTPFGQSLVAAAASSMESEELLPPNVKLDPSYQHLLLDAAKSMDYVSTVDNTVSGGRMSPSGRMSPQLLDDDERTVNSQISAHSFERNPAFSPSTGKIVEDDDKTLDSEMARTHFSMGSHSTLGIPNPVQYDRWLSNNALPIRSTLSRGGLQSAPSASLRRPVADVSASAVSFRDGKAMQHSHSSTFINVDHGIAPVTSIVMGEKSVGDDTQQDTFADDEEEIPYVVHSAPMGWKLTTAARKKYVEATARLAGYGENEFLPMPTKLSKLGETMGVPNDFDKSLRSGGSGPAPSLPPSSAVRSAVKSRGSTARSQAVTRMGAGKLKWRGIENHKLQLKRIDAKLKATVSATNRPNNLVDAGASIYGSVSGNSNRSGGHILVGGKRTKGRKFKGHKEEAEAEHEGIIGMEVSLGELFGPGRVV